MNKKEIIIFMPSINGGGVEKNFFLITNYLSTKFNDLESSEIFIYLVII